jgi:hypothetical protein
MKIAMVADNETLDEEDEKYIDDVSSVGMYTPKVRETAPEPEAFFDPRLDSPEPAKEYAHNQSLGLASRVGLGFQKINPQNSSQTNQRDIKVFDNVRFKNDILAARKQQNTQEFGFIFRDEDDKITADAQGRSAAPADLNHAQKGQMALNEPMSIRGLNNMSENQPADSIHAGPASMPHKVQTLDLDRPAGAAKSVFGERRLSTQPMTSLNPRFMNGNQGGRLETDLFNEGMMKVNPEWTNMTEHVGENRADPPKESAGSSSLNARTENNPMSLHTGPSIGRGYTMASRPSIEFARGDLKVVSMEFKEELPEVGRKRTAKRENTSNAADFKEILKQADHEEEGHGQGAAREGSTPARGKQQYQRVELLEEPL